MQHQYNQNFYSSKNAKDKDYQNNIIVQCD